MNAKRGQQPKALVGDYLDLTRFDKRVRMTILVAVRWACVQRADTLTLEHLRLALEGEPSKSVLGEPPDPRRPGRARGVCIDLDLSPELIGVLERAQSAARDDELVRLDHVSDAITRVR